MKTLVCSLMLLNGFSLLAQNATSVTATPISNAASTPTIATRNANSRTWAWTNYTVTSDGQTNAQPHEFVELATGISHTNNQGDYVDSSDEIVLLPDGSAAATNRASSLYFPSDIGSGLVRLIATDGQALQAGPAFLALNDGTNTVVIATITNSTGELISSNQLLYPDIFHGSGFRADLQCTVHKGGFESDVIFREQVPGPASFGLSTNARLQLLTEWPNTPEPVLNTNIAPSHSNTLSDVTLHFGKARIGRGRAFFAAPTNSTAVANNTPVYKSWIHSGGRGFLVESVPYARLAPQFQQLPAPAGVTASSAKSFSIAQGLPLLRRFPAGKSRVRLATMDFRPKPGLVLDYTELDDSQNGNFEFTNGATYFVNGDFIINGTATFDGGAVIKFPEDGSGFIEAVGQDPAAVWNNDPYHLTIFTSADDDSVGQEITVSDHNPQTQSDLGEYYIWISGDANTNDCAANASFSYAGVAIAGGWGCAITNCQFFKCEIAVEPNGDPSTAVPVICQNDLFSQCSNVVNSIVYDMVGWPWTFSADTTTFDQSTNFSGGGGQIFATNCIFANTTPDPGSTYAGLDNGFYNSPEFGNGAQTNDVSPFQTGIGGNYYLTPGIPFLEAGNTTADQLGLYWFTTQTNQAVNGISQVDLGYHYPAVDASNNPVSTLVDGVPDYLSDPSGNGLPETWESNYFGNINHFASQLDSTGTNTLLYDFKHGLDPNVISFSLSFTNQYVTTSVVTGAVAVFAGLPSYYAVLVDNTNFPGATWNAYTSSSISINLGSTQGFHDVWVGLRGLPANAQQTWQESTLFLDSSTPTISITNPANNASFNATGVDVFGNFTAGSLQQIIVNGVLAFTNGTNFKALNVPLSPGSNTITAVIQDFTGATNAASITVTGLTNSDGSMNTPVQLLTTPTAGFAPLTVAFSILTNLPGTVQQVSYDFNGDGIADFVTNNLNSVTFTYATNGEYFPVVTVHTTAGVFSSPGGWNSGDANEVQITVQPAFTQTVFASVTDPVALKWNGINLYVLSGSSGTINEFATNGSSVGSPFSVGAACSGFDVDAAGDLYVAVIASNQVWKFIPTNGSYVADTNFGPGGFIGTTNGAAGTTNGQFNAPFDVLLSPGGGNISVSDSGNGRIQQFSTNGTFAAAFGSPGSDLDEFNTPKGLAYDSSGALYIADSGNNRIVVASGTAVLGASGTNGTGLLQFNGPENISIGERGIYVADTGNNRIQCFNVLQNGAYEFQLSDMRLVVSTNLNQPASAAAVDNLTNEMFYVTDTANNRVLLYTASTNSSRAILSAWSSMVAHVTAGDITGASSYFSVACAGDYQQAFLTLGTNDAIAAINQITNLAPVFIMNDQAEYYFTNTIGGYSLTFPVEFDMENGVWKILEF